MLLCGLKSWTFCDNHSLLFSTAEQMEMQGRQQDEKRELVSRNDAKLTDSWDLFSCSTSHNNHWGLWLTKDDGYWVACFEFVFNVELGCITKQLLATNAIRLYNMNNSLGMSTEGKSGEYGLKLPKLYWTEKKFQHQANDWHDKRQGTGTVWAQNQS